MRIIAGSLGGRTLRAPAGRRTRPTTDRVREALFSMLGTPPVGCRVLDLFAGSGALGLEALSRGAAFTTFVEHDREALTCLRANVGALGMGHRCEIVARDALQALSTPPGPPWHWVFLDPPYQSDLASRAAGLLDGTRLTNDGTVIIEHDRHNVPNLKLGRLQQTRTRQYGDTWLSFYQLPSTATE